MIVYECIKVGARHIDCAAVYGNEVEVGRGIRKAISEGLVRREDLFIVGKLWQTFHAPEHVELGCQKTLDDLGLDYLDLYVIHFPFSLKFVPIEVRYPPGFFYLGDDHPNKKLELENIPMSATWRVS